MGARAQHDLTYRRLCQLLRQWRTEAELTQRDLADRLDRPRSYVHKCETGDRRIDPVELIRWCRACGQDPAECVRKLDRSMKRR